MLAPARRAGVLGNEDVGAVVGADARGADGGDSEAAEDFASVTPYPAAELRLAYVNKDHPYLLLPWLGTHLCETPALVREMVRGACAPDPALRFMLSWWSAVGKHFGLGLPLDKLSNY